MARQAKEEKTTQCKALSWAMTRRQFLLMSGATVVAVTLPGWLGRPGQQAQALVASYPRKKIGQVSQLRLGEPLKFTYPWDHPFSTNYLFKLGVEAGGGVGRDRDIVAFNGFCTHQGGPLAGRYDSTHQVFGPCPFHLTTFDLTRHGMVVSGHATQGLPQITLEVEGDDIYATGVLGLIYGYHDDEAEPG